MTTISISDLKARLSHILRLVSAGEPVVVLDRKEPVARILPIEPGAASPRERLAQQGRLRLATRDFAKLRFTRLRKKIDIQASLRAVRDDLVTYYVDASVLLAVLFQEGRPKPFPSAGEVMVSSRLAEVETFRALDRERLLGHLDDAQTAGKSKELFDLLAAVDLAPLSDDVLALARATFPVAVRALDALHVATAQVLAASFRPIEFWTHDERQGQAALARGLEVRGLAGLTSARAERRRRR